MTPPPLEVVRRPLRPPPAGILFYAPLPSPLSQELLILREFVEHLQQSRTGASTSEIDAHTASWVVDDVSKLPEELRSCCVCLEDVAPGSKVRSCLAGLGCPCYCTRARPAIYLHIESDPPLAAPLTTAPRPVAPPSTRASRQVRTLPCLHTFHAECAEEWLHKKKVCPLCQFTIDGTSAEGPEAGTAVAGGVA